MPIASKTQIEQIPVSAVEIGQRRRKTVGSVAALKRSIDARGLLHPIIVRGGNELVAGARRLEACRQLEWKTIPARRIETLSDEELRAIELDENEHRLALADYESSKQRLAEIRQAEAEQLRAPGTHKSRGRPKESGSRRQAAKRSGMSESGVRKIEKHVEIAERFPFMQGPSWKQYTVLEAGEKVDAIPEREHQSVAILVDQPGVPPKSAIEIIAGVGAKTASEREAIYKLARSSDPEDRSLALTKAVSLPKEPHRCALALMAARREVAKCKKGHADLADMFDKLIAKMKKEEADV